jgi:hypothetical protein
LRDRRSVIVFLYPAGKATRQRPKPHEGLACSQSETCEVLAGRCFRGELVCFVPKRENVVKPGFHTRRASCAHACPEIFHITIDHWGCSRPCVCLSGACPCFGDGTPHPSVVSLGFRPNTCDFPAFPGPFLSRILYGHGNFPHMARPKTQKCHRWTLRR